MIIILINLTAYANMYIGIQRERFAELWLKIFIVRAGHRGNYFFAALIYS